jgi:hypothetical protein
MGAWRNSTILAHRFHPDFPDDLQVVIHEGGPRFSDRAHELIWVRLSRQRGDIFAGILLNEPHNLPTLKQGDTVFLIMPEGGEYPIRVTDKYLAERNNWVIEPCDKCGFTELFDAPSDLIKKIFPNIPSDASLEGFTSFCALCGGVQIVANKNVTDSDINESGTNDSEQKQWWQFWK